MSFLEKQYEKETCIYLDKLYKTHKNQLFLKEAKKYLDLYPNNVIIRYRFAKVLRYNGDVDGSIEQLNKILKLKPNDPNTLSFLYFTYYHAGRYKEAYGLISILLHLDNVDRTAIYLSRMVIKKNLNIPFNSNEKVDDTYIKRQIMNYSKEEAVIHMKKHLCDSEEETGFPKFKKINLEYLMDVISNNLDKGKQETGQDVMNVYYFSIFGIGENEQEKSNYVKVIVVPGTCNIINMYPVLNPNFKNLEYIDIDYDKLFEIKEKTKSLSMIEKFNKKYNR